MSGEVTEDETEEVRRRKRATRSPMTSFVGVCGETEEEETSEEMTSSERFTTEKEWPEESLLW